VLGLLLGEDHLMVVVGDADELAGHSTLDNS
jgi:hypothetical protein